jgi:hypothetical protein
MAILWDILVILLTIGFIFMLPLFYWLLVGRNNSPTAKDRAAKHKLMRRKP